MTRRDGISIRPLLVAVVVALVLSLLSRRYLGWTHDAAAIILLPSVPFNHPLVKVRTWLRPGPSGLPTPSLDVQQLELELDRFKALFQASELENQRLREEIEQITLAQREGGRRPARFMVASVVGENTQSSGRVYQLNRGSRAGVVNGTIAVHNGVHLIGRIDSVSPLVSLLTPLTNPAIRSAEVYFGRDASQSPGAARARSLLRPSTEGRLVGEVPGDADVRIGDIARLDDPSWPTVAFAMIVGEVISIEPKVENPLRSIVHVRPRFSAEHLASVTLKIEIDGGTP